MWIKQLFKPRYICVGDARGWTLYYDRKLNIPVKSTKHVLMDNKASQNNGKSAFSLTILILSLSTIPVGFLGYKGYQYLFSKTFTKETLITVIILFFVEFIGFMFLMYKVFYSGIKNCVPASKKLFKEAYFNNSIWNNCKDESKKSDNITPHVIFKYVSLVIWVWITYDTYNHFFVEKIIGKEFILTFSKNSKHYLNWGYVIYGLLSSLVMYIFLINDPQRLKKIIKKFEKNEIKELEVNDE